MTITEREDEYDAFYGTGWQAAPDPVVFGPPRYWPGRQERMAIAYAEAVRLDERMRARTRLVTERVVIDPDRTVSSQTAVNYALSRRLRA